MVRNIKLYIKFLHVAVLGKLQYKADFLVGMLSVLILNAVNISLIGILVYNFNMLGGWGIWDLMFLYSFWMLSRAFYGIFFNHFWDFEGMIVSGEFDKYLVRPMSPFLQLLGKDINYSGVGDLLIGIAGFILVKVQLGLSWGVAGWLYFIICVISGGLIQVAINWLGASLCFWTTRSRAAMSIAEQFTVLMQQYPVGIFGKYFQVFVTCFLPVAFINYYPSVIFLGKAGENIPIWQYFAPLVALTMLLISSVVWMAGIKRYAGTGS